MKPELQSIFLKAKENVYTHLSASNLSKVLGQGYDFAELREYNSSDDIRHISWINSAKLGQPYVKKMYEERGLNVAVATLMDGRFVVGEKQKLLTEIYAVLGYSAYKANDSFFALQFFGSEYKSQEPSKEIEGIEKSVEKLYDFEALGTTLDPSSVAKTILDKIEVKSLLFIIGDFLDFIDLSVLAQKHEVIAIIIRDHQEESPKLESEAQLIDPRNKKALTQSLSKKAIQYYKEKLYEHDDKLFQHFNNNGIRYVKIYRSDEVVEKLEGLFVF